MNLKGETYDKLAKEWEDYNEAGGMRFTLGEYIAAVLKEQDEIRRKIYKLKQDIDYKQKEYEKEILGLDEEIRKERQKCQHIQTTYTSGYETYSEECDICGLVLRSK